MILTPAGKLPVMYSAVCAPSKPENIDKAMRDRTGFTLTHKSRRTNLTFGVKSRDNWLFTYTGNRLFESDARSENPAQQKQLRKMIWLSPLPSRVAELGSFTDFGRLPLRFNSFRRVFSSCVRHQSAKRYATHEQYAYSGCQGIRHSVNAALQKQYRNIVTTYFHMTVNCAGTWLYVLMYSV